MENSDQKIPDNSMPHKSMLPMPPLENFPEIKMAALFDAAGKLGFQGNEYIVIAEAFDIDKKISAMDQKPDNLDLIYLSKALKERIAEINPNDYARSNKYKKLSDFLPAQEEEGYLQDEKGRLIFPPDHPMAKMFQFANKRMSLPPVLCNCGVEISSNRKFCDKCQQEFDKSGKEGRISRAITELLKKTFGNLCDAGIENLDKMTSDSVCTGISAGKPLYVYGPVGQGKTYTAVAALRSWFEAKSSIIRPDRTGITDPTILWLFPQDFMRTYGWDDLRKSIKDAYCVVIENLGMSFNEDAWGLAASALTIRINQRPKGTVITSIFRPDELSNKEDHYEGIKIIARSIIPGCQTVKIPIRTMGHQQKIGNLAS